MKYLLLLFTVTFHGQVLHHQMLSSQGSTSLLSNGFVVKQTIGQQSMIGNSQNNFVVMQGFQQNLWSKYISSNVLDDIITTTYPNPFIQTLHFHFSRPIVEAIKLEIFDISGRLLFEQTKKADNDILTIDLSSLLPNLEYLVKMKSSHYLYYTKIIKR